MNEYTRYARDLARSALGLDKEAEQAVTRVAGGALATAQRLAPVESGALRANLRMRRRGSVAVVESTLYYSAFQEFGTSKMAPNPFMEPAATLWGPRLVQEVEKIRDGVVEDLT